MCRLEVPDAAVNRVGSGSKFLPMTGTVAYCYGDRGYIKPDQVGEIFFSVPMAVISSGKTM